MMDETRCACQKEASAEHFTVLQIKKVLPLTHHLETIILLVKVGLLESVALNWDLNAQMPKFYQMIV